MSENPKEGLTDGVPAPILGPGTQRHWVWLRVHSAVWKPEERERELGVWEGQTLELHWKGLLCMLEAVTYVPHLPS